jgi:hypothetical protein
VAILCGGATGAAAQARVAGGHVSARFARAVPVFRRSRRWSATFARVGHRGPRQVWVIRAHCGIFQSLAAPRPPRG